MYWVPLVEAVLPVITLVCLLLLGLRLLEGDD